MMNCDQKAPRNLQSKMGRVNLGRRILANKEIFSRHQISRSAAMRNVRTLSWPWVIVIVGRVLFSENAPKVVRFLALVDQIYLCVDEGGFAC